MKVECEECGWVGTYAEMLQAPNPFCASMTLQGCPSCKEVMAWKRLCDEPDCKREVSCGWPSPDGYRTTCGEHYFAGTNLQEAAPENAESGPNIPTDHAAARANAGY